MRKVYQTEHPLFDKKSVYRTKPYDRSDAYGDLRSIVVEKWLSGLRQRLAKSSDQKWFRGFESHFFCQRISSANNRIYQTELKPRCLKIGGNLERQVQNNGRSTQWLAMGTVLKTVECKSLESSILSPSARTGDFNR